MMKNSWSLIVNGIEFKVRPTPGGAKLMYKVYLNGKMITANYNKKYLKQDILKDYFNMIERK